MIREFTRWLLVSAALEMVLACLLGFVMLVPMQSWGARWRARFPQPRALMSVHLDLVMLALMQAAAAAGTHALPGAHASVAALLLIIGGWLNVTPYVWRLVGVNAFALEGGPIQKMAASVSLGSTLSLTSGWLLLVVDWL